MSGTTACCPPEDPDASLNNFSATYVSGAVPEPSTWALLTLGLAGLGFAGYRKTKSGRTALAA